MNQPAAGPTRNEPTGKADGDPVSPQRHSIAFVSSAHPWTDNRIHYREAATLARAGHKVTLIAVDSPSTAQPAPGVAVRRIRRRSRLARFTVGSLEALRCALATDATIYHFHDPELIPAVPFLRLAGKTVIYDAHEDLPSQIRDKHYIPNRFKGVAAAAAGILVRISSTANRVIAATEKIAEGYPAERATVVRNYPPLRPSDGEAQPTPLRRPEAVYVGAMSGLRGVTEMVRAADSFPDGWSLTIAGHSSDTYRDSLRQLDGWRRVIDHSVVSPDEARDLILSSRVGLVLFQRTAAHVDSLPTKMFEYMSAGIPVIASNFPLWRGIIEEYDCGLLVDETDPSSIAAAVTRYANDTDLLERHGKNARIAAETAINWESQGRILSRVYDNL